MTKMFHMYHLVELSPWPFIMSFLVMFMMSSLILWFKFKSWEMFLISFLIVSFISFMWWRDVVRESLFQGFHTKFVKLGLKLGMSLFIFSEVMFFFAFFWTFTHSSMAPNMEVGMLWPPQGVVALNPFQVPLLNTIVLLSSGVSVTWSHHNLLMTKSGSDSLLMTIILGVYFTLLQAWEYMESSFSMADSIFGSSFFIATGFHGIHVMIGSTFLFYNWLRMIKNQFTYSCHMGYEMAIWYWHFVDVVWLFLFSMVYWWAY